MKKISVVIPCYNEEKNINNIYLELDKVSKEMKKVTFEIIFVDDGSYDESKNIIKKIAKKDKRVRFISFSRNFGKEAAMYAGLNYSTGDYVTIMDCDLQDPPELINDMYISLENSDCDAVALYSPIHNDYGILRKFFTKIWYRLYEVVTSSKYIPGERDCRLMKRRMVNAILELQERNRFTKGIFSYVGFNVYWMKYDIPNRNEGSSKFSLFKLFKYAINGIVAFSTTPLVISTFIGLLFCFISFIAIIFIIFKTLILGDPTSGWPSLACIIIFMGGIQLFFLGIFGLYLSKMYSEIKKRPMYIINETEKDL